MTDYRTIETRADAFAARRNQFHVGETLAVAFGAWIRNLVPFTALSLLVHLPLLVWAGLLLAGDYPDAAYARFGAWSGLALYVACGLLVATVTYGVCMQLGRRPTSMGATVVMGLRRFLPAMLVVLLASVLTAVAAVALVVPGLIVMCMLYVAGPASVIERPGIRGALRRSRALTAGNRPRVFALAVITFLLNSASTVIIHGFGFGFGADAERFFPMSDLARSVVLGPLTATLVATTYVLLRRQRDGVDTTALADVFA